jgi:hypothetical protein
MELGIRLRPDDPYEPPPYVSKGFSDSSSGGVLVESPSGIAFGISLFESCLPWFAVAGSYRVLISR